MSNNIEILQKEYEEYLNKEEHTLSEGKLPLGKQNAVTILSAPSNPIPLNGHPEEHIEEMHKVGDIRLRSFSPERPYYVLFIDDGAVAYFFAVADLDEPVILDAVQIYNTGDITDKDKLHQFEIIWAEDALQAALLINGKFHAVFDFVNFRGYCRTNFPPVNPESSFGEYSHTWTDECIKDFIKE